ncbi:DUF429 domain-containing protein [Ornithinimicrobium tianjinense]|uniref:DUF429 domain-containing protein n=1 Tax=Ornithinimicrobium tianjinense TaxID=1195761 RepID=A0A917BI09_9MICO|nr:DUF429 domain-containing protein [Ornithinimicrobium tianjinense]GGF45474.1 hypothetical protein GCM10011366_11500 [Ornithinimicrobium tianjinense]
MNSTTWWRKLTGILSPQSGPVKRSGGGGGTATSSGARARRERAAHTQPTSGPGRRGTVDPELPVLGLVVTRHGWVGAVLDASGHGTPTIVEGATLDDVVQAAGPVTVVAVDVPIGLPDAGRRQADTLARKELGEHASVVLTTPVREAVYAATFGEANALSREKVGAGLSQQAYDLRRRIMEVDAYLRQDLPFVLVEVVPELACAQLAGAPLSTRRRSAEGSRERREALASAGVHAPGQAPVGVATEHMLDACAAAWTAHRVKTGTARTLPDQPEVFSDGIGAAITV